MVTFLTRSTAVEPRCHLNYYPSPYRSSTPGDPCNPEGAKSLFDVILESDAAAVPKRDDYILESPASWECENPARYAGISRLIRDSRIPIWRRFAIKLMRGRIGKSSRPDGSFNLRQCGISKGGALLDDHNLQSLCNRC